MKFHSPWLDFDRANWPSLQSDTDCEVALIGAGISGLATLYYLLTTTNKRVALFEQGHVASGASGNNAGISVPAIEKSTKELIDEYGLAITKNTFKRLDEARDIIHAIHEEIGLLDNITTFSYAAFGFNSIDLLLESLEEHHLQEQIGRSHWRYLLKEDLKDSIPSQYLSSIELVSHPAVLNALKSEDPEYICAAVRKEPMQGDRMNSARFCYKLLEYLCVKFPERVRVYEHTPIYAIDLYSDRQILRCDAGKVDCQDLILCTNGYTDFTIHDHVRKRPFTKLHNTMTAREGYIASYIDPTPNSFAIGYLHDCPSYNDCPYWYVSHASMTTGGATTISYIGGPEFDYKGPVTETWFEDRGKESLQLIKNFLKITFNQTPKTFPFFWHGKMGYTKNSLRLVGADKNFPHLWYNLGCNGIGILPAIVGAKMIADAMNGHPPQASLFAPL